MIASAIALYLIPFAVAMLARGGRKPRLWALALDIPAVFAVDLLSVMLLARVLPLDWAVVASRPLWLVLAFWLAQKRRLSWPACLDVRTSALVILGVAIGVFTSLRMSRKWVVWDRSFHIALVTAIEGQRVPFHNVYEPDRVLHYHFTGDVHAAVLRALSLGHISSNLALSLSHDIVFAMIGAMIALLLGGRARPAAALVVFGVAAVLLHGPVVEKDSGGWAFRAHMYQSFLTIGFRPHISISGLLVTGLIALICVRATTLSPGPWELAALALPCASLLSITDETSWCIVLASLSAAWLVDGKPFGDTRPQGLLLLFAMGAIGVVTNLWFGGSLAPGGPVQSLAIVPARIADLREGAHPLWNERGMRELGFDLVPLVLPCLAIVLEAVRKPARSTAALAVLSAVAIALSAVLATKIRINGVDGAEAERFFIAVFFIVLVVALWLLPGMSRWSSASGLVVLGAFVPALYTVWWFRERSAEVLAGSESTLPELGADLNKIDCVPLAAARLGERPELTYVDDRVWYFYTSCRSVFDAGYAEPPWTTRIRPSSTIAGHLGAFEQMAPPGATVPAVCSSDSRNDRVCQELRRQGQCIPNGEAFVTCPFPANERRRLLALGY